MILDDSFRMILTAGLMKKLNFSVQSEFFAEAVKTLLFFLLDWLGKIIETMMDDIRVFQRFIIG